MLMLLLLLLMLWLLEENLRVIVFFINIIEGQLGWVVFTNSSINEFYLSITIRVFLQFFYSGGIAVCKFAMINYSRILWRGFELQFGGVPESFQILCQSLMIWFGHSFHIWTSFPIKSWGISSSKHRLIISTTL